MGGPDAAAMPTTTPMRPKVCPRLSQGTTSLTMAAPLGMMRAPATAWTRPEGDEGPQVGSQGRRQGGQAEHGEPAQDQPPPSDQVSYASGHGLEGRHPNKIGGDQPAGPA